MNIDKLLAGARNQYTGLYRRMALQRQHSFAFRAGSAGYALLREDVPDVDHMPIVLADVQTRSWPSIEALLRADAQTRFIDA